ncbi:MAG: beta strand repeat-containing protein [Erythrobacter sp.]
MIHDSTRAVTLTATRVAKRRMTGLLASSALLPAVSALAAASLMMAPSAALAQSETRGGNGGGVGGGVGGGGTDAGISEAGGNGAAAGAGGGGGGTSVGDPSNAGLAVPIPGGAGGNGAGNGGGMGGAGGSGFRPDLGQGQNGGDATEEGGGGGGGGGAFSFSSLGGGFASGNTGFRGGNGGSGRGSGSGGGGGAGSNESKFLTDGASYQVFSRARIGGAGGDGGAGGATGNGGDGGNGGGKFIFALSGVGNLLNEGTLAGGAGGNGGHGVIVGRGGIGGAGLNQTRGSIDNLGTLQGGNGGTGSVAGAGGIGLIGSGITLNNTGTIAGGLSGDKVPVQALAMRLSGTNTITNIGTLTGGVEIASGTTTFDLATDQTLGNVVSGAGTLAKTGAGTLSLTGANTYTGLTTITAGTLAVGNASGLGTAAAGTTVEDGATVAIEGSFAIAETFSIAGNGAGGGGAIRIGSGAPSLNGAITLAADARINSVSPGGAGGFPSFITGAITGTDRNLTLGGSGPLVITGAINLGTGTLTKDGTGQIALAGSNTFGAVNLSGGVLQLNGGAAIDDAALVTIGNGGRLLVSSSETIGGLAGDATTNVFLDAGQTLTVGANNGSSTFAGRIANSGALTKIGTGTLTLSGANSYTGLTTISAGTLIAASDTALGTAAAGTVVQSGATLGLQGGITISETLTLNGSGVGGGGALRNVFGSNFVNSRITLGSDATIAAVVGTLSVLDAVDLSDKNLTIVGAGSANFFGPLQGSGGLTIAGSGSINLFNENKYTGVITVQSGNLLIQNRDVTLDTGKFVINGGNLIFNTDQVISSLSGIGGLVRNISLSSRTLTIGRDNTSTSYAGIISSDLALTKIGTGTLTLTGENLYGGSTTISGGTLQIGNGGTTGTLGGGEVVNNAALVFNRSNNLTVGNVISGSGTLTKQGAGTLTLTGVNTYTEETRITAGTLIAGNASALGTGIIFLSGNGTSLVADFSGSFSTASARRSLISLPNSDVTIAVTSGNTVSLPRDLGIGLNSTVRFGSETHNGVIEFNSVPGFGPGFRLAIDGGTLKIADTDAASRIGTLSRNAQSFTINRLGTLDLNGSTGLNSTLSKVSGTGTIANTGAASTVEISEFDFAGTFDTGSNGITLEGALGGSGSLTKRGAGTLTLASGLNTSGFTGGLTLAEGTLSLQGNLASTFGTITTTGSVIDYGNGITSAAPIAINSDTTQLQVLIGSAAQSGVISQVGGTARGFEKIGAGELVLSGANTYTGLTRVSAGTLTVANSAALGTAAGGTIVNSGATLAVRGLLTLDDAITLNGSGVGGIGALRGVPAGPLGQRDFRTARGDLARQ